MNISITTVVIIILTLLVLVVVGIFLTSSTAPQIQRADASSLFATKCAEYKSRDCSWEITRDADFDQYVSACRELFGDDRESFSCLYTYCQQCKKTGTNPQEQYCYTLCEEARANKRLGIGYTQACEQIASECAQYTACGDVCSG